MKKLILLTIVASLFCFSDYIKDNGYIKGAEVVLKRKWSSLDIKDPVAMEFHPNNPTRAYLITRSGLLYHIKEVKHKNLVEKRVILNLSTFTNSFKETGGKEHGGLMGMALDPEFITNGYIYLNFTSLSNIRQSLLCRFRINPLFPLRIDFLERFEFIKDVKYKNSSALGGEIKFGNDGYLYMSIGTNSTYKYSKPIKENEKTVEIEEKNVAQDKTAEYGKILRINVHTPEAFKAYTIPKNNPFNNKKSLSRDYFSEIYAYGFRNPISLNFNLENPLELYVVDEGSGLRDEINLVRKGANYGWFYVEGDQPLTEDIESNRVTKPIYSTKKRRKGNKRSSIGAGIFYTGSSMKEFKNYYIYTDRYTREIFAIKHKDGKLIKKYYLGTSNKPILAFSVDPNGDLYGLATNDIYFFSDVKGDEEVLVDLRLEQKKERKKK